MSFANEPGRLPNGIRGAPRFRPVERAGARRPSMNRGPAEASRRSRSDFRLRCAALGSFGRSTDGCERIHALPLHRIEPNTRQRPKRHPRHDPVVNPRVVVSPHERRPSPLTGTRLGMADREWCRCFFDREPTRRPRATPRIARDDELRIGVSREFESPLPSERQVITT